MSLLTKAARLFSRRRAEPSVVEHSAIDDAVLRDWRKRADRFDDALSTPPTPETNPSMWEHMGEDVFHAHYTADEPALRDRDSIDPTYRLNRQVLDKLLREDKFRERRPMTRSKGDLSAMGTMGALESLRESYASEEMAEHVERQGEMAEHTQALDHLDEEMANLRQMRSELTEPAQRGLDDQMRSMAGEKREHTDALRLLEGEQAEHAQAMASATANAAQRAAGAAEGAIEAAMLVPGMGKEQGAGAQLDPSTMFELANRARHGKVRKILEMMGALRLSMSSKRRQERRGGYEEIVDIELGDDLQSVLPQEKVLLRSPIGRRDFFRRYQERSLMQFETWSEQELKRGPFIGIFDGSFSMDGAKNEWARALGLAAFDIANREQRNAAAIEFGGPDQTVTHLFPKGKPIDPTTVVEFAEHFFAGGTSILSGLRAARELIVEEAPFHAADILIVTDGEDRLDDADRQIAAELKEMGVRVHGIVIGIAPTAYMLEVCDHTTRVDELLGSNEGSDRLAIDMT